MSYAYWVISFLNVLALITMIFIERKKPQIIISWTVIMFFLPLIGFLFYVLTSGGLSVTTRLRLRRIKFYSKDYEKFIKWQNETLRLKNFKKNEKEQLMPLIEFNNNFSQSTLINGNKVELFSDGLSYIEKLKKDINEAKHSINIEYYIFADDKVGKQVMALLCKKAREGVKVNLIYDSVGSLRTPKRFFRKLKKCGGRVAEFFPPFLHIRLINFKLNFRNHRKIVVIDGKIGYTGGINIRDDHMGKHRRLSPWRDTQIRIQGRSVYSLQNCFFNDWRFCTKDKSKANDLVSQGYFPNIRTVGEISAQVVTSGPESTHHAIKYSMIKAIQLAKKKIILQTPYFIPDEAFFDALKMAILSGVEVILMIPKKPDKKIVYYATLSYARELFNLGAKVYLYGGFLHSKALVVDDSILSVGSCNADNRSFALNFELNCFLYGDSVVKEYLKIVEEDILNSLCVDLNFFKKKPLLSILLQPLYKLFAPLL